jgi:hypothetical protein
MVALAGTKTRTSFTLDRAFFTEEDYAGCVSTSLLREVHRGVSLALALPRRAP